jgi:hypothetical protein
MPCACVHCVRIENVSASAASAKFAITDIVMMAREAGPLSPLAMHKFRPPASKTAIPVPKNHKRSSLKFR